MSRKTNCPVCDSRSIRIVRAKCGFDIAHCAQCRSDFAVLEAHDLPDYDEHYAPGHMYEGYHNIASKASAGAGEKILYWFQPRMLEVAGPGKGRLHVDIGSGLGSFPSVTRRRGWRVMGVDVSQAAAAKAKALFDIDTHVGRLEDINLPPGSVDWISAFEVLEHTLEPREFVASIHRLLKPGGLVTISVPNGRSRQERHTTDPIYSPPTHVTFFSRRGLNMLFTGAGFEKIYDYEKPIAWGELNMGRAAKIALLPWLVFDSFILGHRGNRLLWVGQKKA